MGHTIGSMLVEYVDFDFKLKTSKVGDSKSTVAKHGGIGSGAISPPVPIEK